jgi:RHS repeat-associated protein
MRRPTRASSPFGGPAGDLLKLTYTWQADQIVATDTCLLGTTTPRTETFSYDATLRLTGAGRPTGNFAATGGAFSARSYAYDGRSNRTSSSADGIAVGASYATSQIDRQTGFSAGSLYGYTFSYDADGRVAQRLGPVDSTGYPSSQVDYLPGPGPGGANETVFRSVTVNNSAYNYFYDGLNRRRYKSYPTGISDEYFYDLGHQLLVDQGNSDLYPPTTPTLDEYVWLGGRPVALIRGGLSSAWAHLADGTGTCGRNNDPADCGIYFPVSDVIGKPVLMLNAAGRIAGTGESDPFGHVNRVFIDAETSHPYGTTTGVFASFAQASGSASFAVDVRARIDFADLETQAADPILCTNQPVASDTLDLRDGAGTVLARMAGRFPGVVASAWLRPAGGTLQLALTNVGTCSFPPGPAGTCTTVCDGIPRARSKSGVVAGNYEYRRYESGQNPFWTPLRFPGQYFDAESDLFENWNRYYEPVTGRYLGPEPVLAKPTSKPGSAVQLYDGKGRPVVMTAQLAQRLLSAKDRTDYTRLRLPAYSYAQNNPLAFADLTGLTPNEDRNCPWASEEFCLEDARHAKKDYCDCESGGGTARLVVDHSNNENTTITAVFCDYYQKDCQGEDQLTNGWAKTELTSFQYWERVGGGECR